MSEYSSIKFKTLSIGKLDIEIGGDLVNFYNDRKTYKEYLADRFAPRYKNSKGRKVKMELPVLFNVSAIKTSKKENFAGSAWDRRNMDSARTLIGFKKFNPEKEEEVSRNFWVDVGGDWMELREMGLESMSKEEFKKESKKVGSEYPKGFKFPEHLGRNNDLYKDLKEHNPNPVGGLINDESNRERRLRKEEEPRERRLRSRSYSKKLREENNIFYTKKYGSIVAGTIALPRTLPEATLYAIEATLYAIKITIALAFNTIKITIALAFNAIKKTIVLAFKLPFFPFWLLGSLLYNKKEEETHEPDNFEVTVFGIMAVGIIFVGFVAMQYILEI